MNQPGELYRILLGPDWESASRTADHQHREWAAAFDAWLDSTESASGPLRRKSCRFAWQDFWGTVHRLPWQVEPADVACWIADLERRGRSPVTIRERVLQLEKFYKFRDTWRGDLAPAAQDGAAQDGAAQGGAAQVCAAQVCAAFQDPAARAVCPATPSSPPAFNPIKGVLPPRIDKSAHLEVMSREQVHALLAAVDRDASLVGRRDYVLILAGLVTGVEAGRLRTLRWGDLPGFIDEVPGAAGLESTAALHRAIEDYLRLSGRWETIAPAHYLFAPLGDPLTVPSGKASDWDPQRPLSNVMLAHLLKRYACWAGLDGDRITWHTLRNTAALLRMDAGETLEGLQAFLGHSMRTHTQQYLSRLAGRQNIPLWLPGVCSQRHHSPMKRWQRRPRGRPRAQPGNTNHLKHGFSAARPSLKEVLDEIDPDEIGLEWETLMLRAIMRRAIELCQDDISPKDWLHMMERFSMAAQRLANLLRAGSDLQKSARETNESSIENALRTALDDVIKEFGIE